MCEMVVVVVAAAPLANVGKVLRFELRLYMGVKLWNVLTRKFTI